MKCLLFLKLFDANDDGMVTVKEFVAFINDFIISDVNNMMYR